MRFNDRTANRQAHPQAAGLGRVEGLEGEFGRRRWQTRTRILHQDERSTGFGLAGGDQQLSRPLRHPAHCFDGIDYQVQDDLLQLDPICSNERQAIRKSRLHRNAVLDDFATAQKS